MVISKAATESVTNSTALQNDNDFAVALEANTAYTFQLLLFWTCANSTPGLKLAFTGPTSPTLVKGLLRKSTTTATLTNADTVSEYKTIEAYTDVIEISTGNPPTDFPIEMIGMIETGANSGTFRLQWAQQTAGANATQLLRGSTLSIFKAGDLAIGPQGVQGPQGYQGWQGVQGWQGTGVQGPQGDNPGSQGPQGPFSVITAYKTADESVTSSTAFQNDDHLFFAMEANKDYQFEMAIFYLHNSSPDVKIQFTGPASINWIAGVVAWTLTGTATDFTSLTALDTSMPYIGSSDEAMIVIRASISNGANAGNLKLQWAQNTSNGTAVTFRKGSYVFANKLT